MRNAAQDSAQVRATVRRTTPTKPAAMAQFPLRALIPTMSATRWRPARCHLTCTAAPTLTSHHEPCAPPSTNRVLSVTWYVEARPLRTAVKVRAASSRAVTVPPPLGDPKYAGAADADETQSVAAATNPR